MSNNVRPAPPRKLAGGGEQVRCNTFRFAFCILYTMTIGENPNHYMHGQDFLELAFLILCEEIVPHPWCKKPKITAFN